MASTLKGRYCGPCDRWWSVGAVACPACGADTDKGERPDLADVEQELEEVRAERDAAYAEVGRLKNLAYWTATKGAP